MKLEYSKSTNFIALLLILALCIIPALSSEYDIRYILVLLAFIILLLFYILYDISRRIYYKSFKKKGIKKQGYIYNYSITRGRGKGYNVFYSLYYILDGQSYKIDNLKNNEAFSYISKQLEEYTSNQSDLNTFSKKTYPIDIYEYNNKKYADLDSVKLN